MSFCRIIAEISCGVKSLPSILTTWSVPMKRLIEPDRAIRVGDGLALRQLAYEPLTGFREGDDRRGRAASFGIRDDDRRLSLHDRDDRIGRTEVDPDNFSHVLPFLFIVCAAVDHSQAALSRAIDLAAYQLTK